MCFTGDACEVFHERIVRAGKPHRCDECDAPIPRGTPYVRIGSLFEGDWSTLHVHWECMLLWRTVQADLCEGNGLIVIGGLEEELRGYDDDNCEYDKEGEELPTAAAPYRARLAAIRAKYTLLGAAA